MKNFLSGLGRVLGKLFSPQAIKVEATVADILLPGFAPLIDTAATAIISAETAAIAAGVQSGTGVQKFNYALSVFGPSYDAWAAANKLPTSAETKGAFLQKVVDLLGLVPAIEQVVAPPAQ